MMNRYLKPIVLALLVGWALLATPLWAQTQDRPSRIDWVLRPWEMRYFIYVESAGSWQHLQKLAAERNQKSMKDFFSWKQFFEAQTVLRIPHWELAQKPEKAKYPEDLAVVVIEFNKDGWVTTPNSFGKPLRGRLNTLSPGGYIVLSPGDALTDPVGSLGDWFIGLNEDTADGVTPALCSSDSIYEPMRPSQEYYVYGNQYQVKKSWSSTPPFQCREWAWQMHEADRPYIDVTSYVPIEIRKSPHNSYPHGTYILPFMGWSRFDRQKPVIGKHADTWYCLHECPGSAQPGPIADINAWAKANGWTPPKPPTRMPVFPDDPGRRGKYQLTLGNGRVVSGITDSQGRTQRVEVHIPDDFKRITASLVKGDVRLPLPVGKTQHFAQEPFTHWRGKKTEKIAPEVRKLFQQGPQG